MLRKLNKAKGFTLIEVVIVLAIAALILLVVFNAIASAQKSQRDTTRKTEAGRIVSLLEQSASNASGVYPSTTALAKTAVTGLDSKLGAKYTFTAGTYVANGALTGACATSPTTAAIYEVLYVTNGATNRDYELSVCTEGGGLVQVK